LGPDKLAELRQHIQSKVEQLRTLGWRDEELWVEAFDEPTAGPSESWLACAKMVKEAAPGVRMWINPGWQRYQTEEAFGERNEPDGGGIVFLRHDELRDELFGEYEKRFK